MGCAARAIDAGEVLAAVVVGPAGFRETVAGRTLLADLVRGIADQPRATVAVMLTWMPGRDAGRLAMALVANQPVATIVIDRAGFGVDAAGRRAVAVIANESVAAVVGVCTRMRHWGASRHAPAARRIAAQIVTACDAIAAGHALGSTNAGIAGAVLANDVRSPGHAESAAQPVVRRTADGNGVLRIAPAASGTVVARIARTVDADAVLSVAYEIAATSLIDMARAADLMARIQADFLVWVAEEPLAAFGIRA